MITAPARKPAFEGWGKADLLALVLLLGVIIAYASRLDFSIAPFEDAAMIMRYAQHWSQGHGIVWNIGGDPVDGATDFLFLAVVTLFMKLGMAAETAVRGITIGCHVLTIGLIYFANRRLFRIGSVAAFAAAAFLAVGPGLHYAAAYFGTPFFGLLVACAWYSGLKATMENSSYWPFAGAALAAALTRPEGVILGVLMVIGFAIIGGQNSLKKAGIAFFAVFATLGLAYFVWRWHEFGYPLPNPYYKKGGGALHMDALKASIRNLLFGSLPFFLACIVGAIRKDRVALAGLFVACFFAGSFILVSDEMNFGARFQYATLPVLLISWAPGLLALRSKVSKQTFYAAGAVAAVVFCAWRIKQDAPAHYFHDSRYDVAVALSKMGNDKTYMATTEAGLLPYYSGWSAIDTWGLNDQWIAHNGKITSGYLDRFHPELIVVHDHQDASLGAKWQEMTKTLLAYADQNHYVLAGDFGPSKDNTHRYYVRQDRADIYNLIHGFSYRWSETGQLVPNYAAKP